MSPSLPRKILGRKTLRGEGQLGVATEGALAEEEASLSLRQVN